MNHLIKGFALIFIFNTVSFGLSAKNEVKQLICEYKTNPLGIDVLNPRLSWQLTSSEKEVMQNAYEIRIAETPEKLNSGKLIWSTGKVNGSQSVGVVYNGPSLLSMQRVYWQVRVWDNKNEATAWSETASWEMGILKPTDWKASWI